MTTVPAPPAGVDAPASPATTGRGVLRHRPVVRITHWLNAIFLAGMVASGLQIYASYPHIGYHGDSFAVPNPFDASRAHIPKSLELGGWLAAGLRWHFTLAWPFVITGLVYVGFLLFSGEWRALVFRPRDVPAALQMTRYYLRLRPDHPVQGKHNALQKSAYTFIIILAVISVLSGFAVAKPVQLGWLTALFGGYEWARYWHFVAVWTFTAFTIVHVILVFAADPASIRAILTGRYRGKFVSNE